MSTRCAAARDLDMESRANCAGSSGAGCSGTTSAGAGCSGTTEAQQQPAGMRVFLSQIKEWHLEVAADMVFIVVRTDCAWYKVRSVLPAYGGWFRPILKVCSLAAHLLGMIAEASRSSKLSFLDIVNSLSSLKVEDSPSIYVSSKKDQVLQPFVPLFLRSVSSLVALLCVLLTQSGAMYVIWESTYR